MTGDGTLVTNRDIVIHSYDGGVLRLNELNGAYDSLHYVLMFPYGQPGYQLKINYRANQENKYVTPMEFYSYMLMTRIDEGQWIQRYGRIFQQYITDMYAKVENQRLLYIRNNQKKIRSELYSGLQDVIANGNYQIF